LEGQRGQLWAPSPTSNRQGKRKRKPPDKETAETERAAEERRRHQRATELLKEGLFQKACGALVHEPPTAVTSEVVQEMQEKHPAAREEDLRKRAQLREVSAAAAPDCSKEAVAKAIMSFPRGSAPGLSGLRPQHLKEAMRPGVRDELASHLQQLVNLMARGSIPHSVQGWLCGASLVALPKPAGGNRPFSRPFQQSKGS
jgi:hypothetical protein